MQSNTAETKNMFRKNMALGAYSRMFDYGPRGSSIYIYAYINTWSEVTL
jgi:hypothetical protein